MSDFNDSLFGCCNDCGICLCGFFCPCVLTVRNKAEVDGRSTFCCDCLCISNPVYTTRLQIRSKYGFNQNPCGDCLASCVCIPCANCQHGRELKARD